MVKKQACTCAWTAYHLVHMVNGLFMCPIKATGKKQNGNKDSQFFYKLVLALLVRLAGATTNASADPSQHPIRAGVGWVWLARRIPCL